MANAKSMEIQRRADELLAEEKAKAEEKEASDAAPKRSRKKKAPEGLPPEIAEEIADTLNAPYEVGHEFFGWRELSPAQRERLAKINSLFLQTYVSEQWERWAVLIAFVGVHARTFVELSQFRDDESAEK